jgi:hypothetical protein
MFSDTYLLTIRDNAQIIRGYVACVFKIVGKYYNVNTHVPIYNQLKDVPLLI